MAAALCIGLLAGCGGDDADGPEAQISALVTQLEQASKDGDGDRICKEIFNENLRISVQRASDQPCADEVAENVTADDADYDIENLEVNGKNATAELVDQRGERSAVLFQQEGDEWRIGRIAGVGS